jgi:hypothetical protein
MKADSDINWRSISEDDSLFDEDNKYRTIIYTTVQGGTIFQAYCDRIDQWSHRDSANDERVFRYAFA